MDRFILLSSIAVALFSQEAIAKSRVTDPLKIARECKTEVELFCTGVRPGGQRITSCLKAKAVELSPACLTALKSAE
jgi:hypothetical protein